MKKFIYKTLLISSFIFLFNCVNEDYFGYTDRGVITKIQMSNQSGNPVYFTDKDSIYLEVANGADLANLTVNSLELTSFAQSDKKVGDVVNATSGSFKITVTAESGKKTFWTIGVFKIGSQPQIENSNFNSWYQDSDFLDIGKDDASSSWATSNPGVVFGGMDANVLQVDLGNGNFAAKLITRFSRVGGVVGKPIASGSLFTGDFDQDNINISNPQASVLFGIPFTASPKSFSVDYQYKPGPKYINSHQQILNQTDAADIYALLERREGNTIKRVATAWLRTSDLVSTTKTLTLNFIYGPLPSTTPEYMLPKTGEVYAETNETPTHITVVFASSAKGDVYEGAENSTLLVDNFKLNY